MSAGRTSKYIANITENATDVWKCGVYLRLSREDGDKLESDSISNQRKIIDRYLEKNPDIEIFDIYTDDGFSGSNFDRPDITRLLEDIKNRKVNCLIVKDLSRFGRNYHETGRYLEVVFPLLKLRFISVNDNIDSYKNPQSVKNSSVSFKNVINDEYCRDISNKVRSVFDAKRKRGEYIGSFALYGYIKDPTDRHRIIIDEEAAENVRLIFRLFLNGMSIYNIALKLKELGVLNPTEYKLTKGYNNNNKLRFSSTNSGWSTQTIRRMLKNQMYIGNMVQGKQQKVSHKIRKCISVPKECYIIKLNTHEAIIDTDTFNKVQERFTRDTWQYKGETANSDEMLTGAIYVGYVKCADCGRAMQRSGYIKNCKSFYYFICGSYLQWKQCSRHALRVNKLNEIVMTVIQKHISIAVEMDALLQIINKQKREDFQITRLNRGIKSCENERETVIKLENDLYIDYKGDLLTREQYTHFRQEYTKKLSDLEERLSALQKELSQISNENSAENLFIEVFKKYKNFSSLNREIIADLIDMIYVRKDGAVEISLKYRDEFAQVLEMIQANQNYFDTTRLQEKLVN